MWACTVPVWEHQASAVRACNVPVREHQASAVRACNVPSGNTRPRQFGLVMSPSGNTRPRQFGPVMSRPEHQASGSRCESGPTVSRAVSPSLFGEKPPEAALTAPKGSGGPKLLLLDERCDSSVDLREWRPADQAGGRGVTTGPSRSVGSSTCSTGSDAA